MGLTIGINQGMGEVEHGKIYAFSFPPKYLRLVVGTIIKPKSEAAVLAEKIKEVEATIAKAEAKTIQQTASLAKAKAEAKEIELASASSITKQCKHTVNSVNYPHVKLCKVQQR